MVFSPNVFPVLGEFICTIAARSAKAASTFGRSYLIDSFSPDGLFSWYRHFKKSDLVFEFFHNQTRKVDIHASCGERIHLSHLAAICIQCKDSRIAGHALLMLKLAFFSLDTIIAALHMKVIIAYSSIRWCWLFVYSIWSFLCNSVVLVALANLNSTPNRTRSLCWH